MQLYRQINRTTGSTVQVNIYQVINGGSVLSMAIPKKGASFFSDKTGGRQLRTRIQHKMANAFNFISSGDQLFL